MVFLSENISLLHTDGYVKAKAEYDVYNKKQKIFSDFDREIKKLLDKSGDKQ